MMKAGVSTTAISPAPLTLSAGTLRSRGGRSESRGGGEAGTARPTGVNNPHLWLPLHGGPGRLSEPYTARRGLPPPRSAELRASRRGSQAELSWTEIAQEVDACLSSSQMQKWRRSFLSINNSQHPLATAILWKHRDPTESPTAMKQGAWKMNRYTDVVECNWCPCLKKKIMLQTSASVGYVRIRAVFIAYILFRICFVITQNNKIKQACDSEKAHVHVRPYND